MIKKICFSLIFVCLLVSIPLALMGIKYVSIGGPFLAFLRGTNMELQQYKFEIPTIPNVPDPAQTGGWWDALGVLVAIANAFISICNFAIGFMNTLIAMVQFVFILLRRLMSFSESLSDNAVSSYTPPVV